MDGKLMNKRLDKWKLINEGMNEGMNEWMN